MGKGILLEMAGREAMVLTPQGEFRKVPVPVGNWEIGDEIEYAEARQQQPLWLRWGTAAAAAAVFFVGSFVGYNQYTLTQPVAVVTVDINPSLELTLNKVDQVLSAKALNDDGALVLQGVDFKRKPLDEVLVELTDRAVAEQKLNPLDESSAVVVGIAPVKEKELPQAQVERVVEKAKTAVVNEVAKVAASKGQTPKTNVAVLTATVEERKQAEEAGLSVGKSKLLPEIQSVVPEVTAEELQRLGPGKLLKEHGVNPSEIFSQAEKKNEEPKGKSKSEKDEPTAEPASAPAGKSDEKKSDDKQPEKKQPDEKKDEGKKSSGAQQENQPGADQKDSSKQADPKQGDSKKDEPKQADPKKDEPKQGDSKQEEPKKGESKQQELKKNDSKQEEPKKGDSKQEEPKKNDSKKDEPKKDEPKKDEPKKDSWTIPWLGITIEKPAFLRDKNETAEAQEAPAVATPRAEEPGAGAPQSQAPVSDAPKAEEPKKEESKKEESKKEDREQSEPKQDAEKGSEKESKEQGKGSGKTKEKGN